MKSWYCGLVLGMTLLWMMSSGCRASTPVPASKVLGRWQRVGEPGIGEPEALLSEFIELRQGGQLLRLLWDAAPDQFWTVGEDAYTLPVRDQIEITGSCWRSRERYACTRRYRFVLTGDRLRIFDAENGGRQVVYRRAGAAGADPPPWLGPPAPSATPQEQE